MIILFTDVGDTVGYGKYAGTYRLATELRNNGFPTQVVDNFRFLGINRLKKVLDKFLTLDTLFIGISLTLLTGYRDKSIWGIPEDKFIELVSYAKSINPNIKFVAGGFQVNSLSSWPYIDYVVTNKADTAIVSLANHLKNDSPLIYKQPLDTKVINGDDYFFTQEEFSNSKIIFEDNDIILPGEVLPIEVARGCIFKCAFCWHDLIGKKKGDWTKTEDTLVEELTYAYNKYGVTQYMVSDELVNESLEKLEMLVRVAKRLSFKFEYTAYARIDMVVRYPQMIDLLLESGAVGLAFGIETFHLEAGKSVGKGMDPNKIKETLQACKDVWKDNILLTANFMIGLPGEPKESILETMEYLIDPNCPIDTFELNLLNVQESVGDKPGNKIGETPEKFGFEIAGDGSREWESNTMTRAEGRQLMQRIKQDPVIQNKRKFTSAIYIGRVLSLGYSIANIFDIMKNKSLLDTKIETMLKSNLMKEEYYKRLMAL